MLFSVCLKYELILSSFSDITCEIDLQQVPDEVDSVMVRVESYLSMRRHSGDVGFRVFELDEAKHSDNKVNFFIL